MRIIVVLAVFGLVSSLAAGSSGEFAKSGRILTIEQWRSPEGMAWAVQDRQIVVYRMFDYVNAKDQLIATKSISAVQFNAIKEAINRLPKDSIGYRYEARLSTDAPMLRLVFRSDGALDSHVIEVDGHFPKWIEEVVGLVSSVSQPEAPITFGQVIADYRERLELGTYSPSIRKIDLLRVYGEPKPWWKFWK